MRTIDDVLETDGWVDCAAVRFANAGTNNEYLGCSGHVQPGTVRIYGKNDGRLDACPACSTPRNLRQGAGKDPDYDPAVDRGKSTASGYHPIVGGDDRATSTRLSSRDATVRPLTLATDVD